MWGTDLEVLVFYYLAFCFCVEEVAVALEVVELSECLLLEVGC